MEVVIDKQEERTMIELVGDLDGNSSGEVTEKILGILEETNRITIDMAKCLYVSSAGLRTLLTIGKGIRAQQGDMTLVNLSEEVKDVMEMTGFSGIFKAFEQA